ncbi:MAG TPA: amidohydrolase family protein [Pseudomonadales bacterium]
MLQLAPRLKLRSTAALLSLSLLAACGGQQEATAPPAAAPQPAAPPSTAVIYEGARVIVGDGSVMDDATFVVDGGQFTAVGASGAVDVPDGAERIDLAGATVMPAIIDTHVHLSRERDALIEDLRRRAYFGVSAAMSLGQDEGEPVFQLRNEPQGEGLALYRTAGRGITAPEPGRSDIPHWVTTVEEARAAVQEEAALGVDIIKIWVDDRDDQFDKLTPELYGAVIDEAHANNLRVVAHLFDLEDAKGLVRAGVDAFAHGVRDMDVDDEFIELVKANPDFVLGPNLPGRGVVTDVSWLQGQVTDEQFAQLQQQAGAESPEAQEAFGIQARNLARMSEEGVTIVLGTDGNSPWGPHMEMEDMVAAGMMPLDVITAATRNGAAYLRLDDRGTIADGQRADFIVLDANPLDDIKNTRQIRSVYFAGEEVERGD